MKWFFSIVVFGLIAWFLLPIYSSSPKSSDELRMTQLSQTIKGKQDTLKDHKKLEFMVGEWHLENVVWRVDGEPRKSEGEMSVRYINNLVLLWQLRYSSSNDIPGPVAFISYDAQADDYVHSVVSPRMTGVRSSYMNLLKIGEKYIFFEEFGQDGVNFNIRHEIMNSGNKILWDSFVSENSGEFEPFFSKVLTKK